MSNALSFPLVVSAEVLGETGNPCLAGLSVDLFISVMFWSKAKLQGSQRGRVVTLTQHLYLMSQNPAFKND